jgi:hypothetical protein
VTRRGLIATTVGAVLISARAIYAETGSSIRGMLEPGEKPAIVIEGRRVSVTGDEDTLKVLADDRLKGVDFEAEGRYESPGHFVTSLQSLAAYQDGKKRFITYWCSNCSVRYRVPGPCVCCGQITELQLRDTVEE